MLNVLIGDMSFVGPRPTVGKINPETFIGDRKRRYDVKPGVTGYSQAFLETPFPWKRNLSMMPIM